MEEGSFLKKRFDGDRRNNQLQPPLTEKTRVSTRRSDRDVSDESNVPTVEKMPRPGFQAREMTAGDIAQADAFEALAEELASQTMRRFDQLEQFVRENRAEFKRTKAKRSRIFARFAGQFRHSDRAESTLAEALSDYRRYAVDPWNTEPARERVRLARLISAVNRVKKDRGRIFNRKISREPLPLVPQERPKKESEALKLAFWALVCVTGNRAQHVHLIRKICVKDTEVKILWARRKVRSNEWCTYLFEWSDTPPDWVLEIWKRKTPIWPWKPGTKIASAVNAWLIRWGSPLSASSPREALDRRLIALVFEGTLPKLKYESLIDHTVETHLSNYAQAEEI